uniref:A disintegrin and metalloproteinase with thrombospondin motifs adt-2-like n=1 Tax=Crassostrea virginica TaxID=6565 RepID=A0A8B8E656_CRAVI|nr:A disintegrin and metalloproteinase with thrombospondin motifs adt-2-like [Crassostrea virginica]
MHAFQSLFLFVFASFISESSTEKRFLLLPFLDIPVHYDHWSSWGECLGPCGGTGTRQRIRGCHEIQLGIIHYSAKCPISGEQKETCNGICQQTTVAKTTTTLGVWGNWGKFSSCDKTCGGGTQIRHRVCGGGNCAGDSLESVSCNSHLCPDRLTTATTSATTTSTKQATTSKLATTTHRQNFITIRSNK